MTEPTTTDSDLADQLVQDLRTTYGAIWLFMPRIVALIERLKAAEIDAADRINEALHAVNEDLANRVMPPLQERIAELEAKLATVEGERDHLREIYDAANADRDSYAGQIDKLREQVERLTEELKETNAQK